MDRLQSFLAGQWTAGTDVAALLLNPATEDPLVEIAQATTSLGPALAFARAHGGPALRAMTFGERAALLRALAKMVHAHRDELITLAIANGGNTRSDAKFDVDGASGVFSYYADVGEKLGGARWLLEGESTQLGRSARWHGVHALGARTGVAVLINAFNFPAWGVAEKAACALLAGMPVLARPATPTALIAHRLVALAIEKKMLPEGALSLLVGGAGDLVAALGPQDVLAFTGSSDTAAGLRARVPAGARMNVEADSLNVAVVGPDVAHGTPTYDQLLADVAKEMVQKTGQKCTAIRRVLVSPELLPQLGADLAERLAAVRVGDPALDEIGMGPLATARQRDDVRAGVAALAAHARAVFGGGGEVVPVGVASGKGFFVGPVLFEATDADAAVIHEREVFGPVATLVPAADAARAGELARRGGGGLVASIYSDDRAFLGAALREIAPWHGRVHLASAKIAGQISPPGTAMPQLNHGGPGRAGGGEELGGLGGLRLYQQRTAVAGDKAILDALFGKLMWTRERLVQHVEAGASVEYLLFWGHTPRQAGVVDASCLSQWFPARFEVDGVGYATAEHFMMAAKARLFGDADALAEILVAASPAEAKAVGRRVRDYDDKAWGAARLTAVVQGNVAKFGQHADLGAFLRGTGERVLVEASPRDRIWGIGMGASNPDARSPARWRGQNLLGFALMQARLQLA